MKTLDYLKIKIDFENRNINFKRSSYIRMCVHTNVIIKCQFDLQNNALKLLKLS